MTMTPEERAVIQAAIEWQRARDAKTMPRATELREAVWALITRCPECNAGGHVCPGDGNSIGHGDRDCGEHDDAASALLISEREDIRRGLEEYALGATQEWMRIIEIDSLPGQPRVTWQDHQGAFLLGEHPLGDEYGAFRLSVKVTDLGAVPPIGPENDPAQIEEMRPDACLKCGGPCEDECQFAVESEQPQWITRTWEDVRPGDRVRLPGTEHVAEVESAIALPWHVHPAADPYRPNEKRAEWREIKVRLAGRDGLLQMDPGAAIEIELTPSEIAAIEALGGWSNRVRQERA